MKRIFQQKITSTKKLKGKNWNQINVLSMDSVLGANCHMSLLHKSKRKICIEKKINESMSFLLRICLIQIYTQKVFREQVKPCFSKTFGIDTNKHIHKTLKKQNTRVLALVVFYELGNINSRKIFKVLNCVIYTIIDRYVCIDYLGTEKK